MGFNNLPRCSFTNEFSPIILLQEENSLKMSAQKELASQRLFRVLSIKPSVFESPITFPTLHPCWLL